MCLCACLCAYEHTKNTKENWQWHSTFLIWSVWNTLSMDIICYLFICVMYSKSIQSLFPAIKKLAVRHFLCCSGAYGPLSLCLGEEGADTRPFDPCYFPLQTIDFNYQAPLSAAAPSHCICAQKSKCWLSEIHQLQYGSLLVSLWISSVNCCRRKFDGCYSVEWWYYWLAVCKGTLTCYNIERWV